MKEICVEAGGGADSHCLSSPHTLVGTDRDTDTLLQVAMYKYIQVFFY